MATKYCGAEKVLASACQLLLVRATLLKREAIGGFVALFLASCC